MSAHSSVIALLEDVAKSLSDGYAFGYGAADEFNSIKDKAYPYIWLDPVEGSFTDGIDAKLGNTIRWDISLNFLKLDDTHGNEDETARVWEDTFAIMQKYIHKLDEFSLNVENLNIIESDKLIIKGTRFTARRKGTTDHISGWTLTFQMETLAAFDYCSVYDGISVVKDSLVFSDFAAVKLSDIMLKADYDPNRDGKFELNKIAQGGAANNQVLTWNDALGTWQPQTPAGGGSGDMILANAQTVTGAKTFNNGTLLMRNAANTISSQFSNTNTAPRTYTLPNESGIVALRSDLGGFLTGVYTGTQRVYGTGGASFTIQAADEAAEDTSYLILNNATGEVGFYDFATGNSVALSFSQLNGALITDQILNRGLTGAADYSANYLPNTYVQKVYVDAGLAARTTQEEAIAYALIFG